MIRNTALVHHPRTGENIRFGPYAFDNAMARAQWEIDFELGLEDMNTVLSASVKGYYPVTAHFTQDPQIDEDSEEKEEMEPMEPPPAKEAIANLRRWLSNRAAGAALM